MNYCTSCKTNNGAHLMAVTESHCRRCNKSIISGSYEIYSYCNECSLLLNKCEKCGKNLPAIIVPFNLKRS